MAQIVDVVTPRYGDDEKDISKSSVRDYPGKPPHHVSTLGEVPPGPRPGQVVIWSDEIDRMVQGHFGDENPPKVVEGAGGWEIVPIPNREAITQWKGRNPIAVSFSIMFEYNFAAGTNVEARIRALMLLAGFDTDDEDPPLLQWRGNGPFDFDKQPGWMWFIETCEEVDSRRNTHGNRIRAIYNLQLRKYNPGEYLKGRKNKKTKPKKGKKVRHYKVKARDLKDGLRGIAKRELGDAKRWKEIAKLNGIRDPMNIKKGQSLKMPPKKKSHKKDKK